MREAPAAPAWVSTAIGGVVSGPLRRGVVLSSSRLATYILLGDTSDPSVVAVVAPGAVRLPVAACVPRLPPMPAGARARVGAGLIAAAGHTWRPVRWWDPSPRLDATALRTHGWRLTDVVAAEPRTAYGVQVELARAVVAALVAGDPAPACGLLGAGPGLTPAGDDVVAGALAALVLADRVPADVVPVITAAARTRTTALSASLLSAAARGQVVPEAARTLRALTRNDMPEAASAAAGLFAIGATSGHDLALGLAVALTEVADSATTVRALEAT